MQKDHFRSESDLRIAKNGQNDQRSFEASNFNVHQPSPTNKESDRHHLQQRFELLCHDIGQQSKLNKQLKVNNSTS